MDGEEITEGGIILPPKAKPEPEPEPEPEPIEPERKLWKFCIGHNFFPEEANKERAKEAIQTLFLCARQFAGSGICRGPEQYERERRLWAKLNDLSEDMIGETPCVESLC